MDFDTDVYLLSQDFIDDHPITKYPELMYKPGRPYNCLLVDMHYDYLICIPYRSSISHKNAFLFKGTLRSRQSKSGLDYSKMVLIQKSEYISSQKAIIDSDEYRETMHHITRIVQDASNYINTFVAHITGNHVLHAQEYQRKYGYSTLPYFHQILSIK